MVHIKNLLSAVFRPSEHFKKIYLRVLSIMTAIFICVMCVISPLTVSADVSDWLTPNNPSWKAYGFSSSAEYQKAVNQGFLCGTKACQSYNSNASWTANYNKIYAAYGYSSQADFEAVVDSGQYYNDITDTISTTAPNYVYGGGAGLTVATQDTIAVASELSGVKFSTGQSLSSYCTAYLKELSAELDDVTSDFSKSLQSQTGETAAQIKSDLATGTKDWNQLLTVSKNGWTALSSAAMLFLTKWISGFAGQSDASSGSTLAYANGVDTVLPKGKNTYINMGTFNDNSTLNYKIVFNIPSSDSDASIFFLIGSYPLCVINSTTKSVTKYLRMESISQKVYSYISDDGLNWSQVLYGASLSLPSVLQVEGYLIDATSYDCDVTISALTDVPTYIGDCSSVTDGTSQNTAYPNTYTNGSPSYAIDTSKSTSPSDLVGTTAATIDQNSKVPVVVPSATSTPVTASTGTSSTDPSSNFSNPTSGLNFKPLEVALDKFPFCIPFDMINSLKDLVALPQEPSFTIYFPAEMCAGKPFLKVVKLSDYGNWSVIIAVSRWLLSFAWTWFLIIKTRDLVRG